MSDELDTLSDDALNELFAVEVAGWHISEAQGGWGEDGRDLEKFTTDANAVLPWLEKLGHPDWGRDAEYSKGTRWNGWMIILGDASATAPTFARAAVIALIRVKRATLAKEAIGFLMDANYIWKP